MTKVVDDVQAHRPELDLPTRLDLPEGLHRQPPYRSYVIMNSVLGHLHPVKVKDTPSR